MFPSFFTMKFDLSSKNSLVYLKNLCEENVQKGKRKHLKHSEVFPITAIDNKIVSIL